MKVEYDDFSWGEFLETRKKMIVWLRLYGRDGDPEDFERIASTVSCDPGQARLIYESTLSEEEKGG